MNDPKVVEQREQKIAAMNRDIERMKRQNAGRPPSWDDKRLMQLDRAALEFGKRCIMWDDSGAGFYYMMNWDWERNCPAHPASTKESAAEPGWIIHARAILRPPLFDPSVSDDKIASWLDMHTMRVHDELFQRLEKIHRVNENERRYQMDENDEYWQQLKGLDDDNDQ